MKNELKSRAKVTNWSKKKKWTNQSEIVGKREKEEKNSPQLAPTQQERQQSKGNPKSSRYKKAFLQRNSFGGWGKEEMKRNEEMPCGRWNIDSPTRLTKMEIKGKVLKRKMMRHVASVLLPSHRARTWAIQLFLFSVAKKRNHRESCSNSTINFFG